MEIKDILPVLAGNESFISAAAEYLQLDDVGEIEFSPLAKGFAKHAYLVSCGNSDKKFVVKVISNPDPKISGGPSQKSTTTCPEFSIYEFGAIRRAKESDIERPHFPQNIGLFIHCHQTDGYTGNVDQRFLSFEDAVRHVDEKEAGHFMFIIAEEYIEGRVPTEEELVEAERIQAEGMKRDKAIWGIVDVSPDDVIVEDGGRIVFIDPGNFYSFDYTRLHLHLCRTYGFDDTMVLTGRDANAVRDAEDEYDQDFFTEGSFYDDDDYEEGRYASAEHDEDDEYDEDPHYDTLDM